MKIKLANLWATLNNPQSPFLVLSAGLILATLTILGIALVLMVTASLSLEVLCLSGLGVLFIVCCLRVLYALTLGE